MPPLPLLFLDICVFWTCTKAFSLQLVRAFGRWPRVDHRFPSAVGANSCEPALEKVTFWGLLVGCCCHFYIDLTTPGLPRQALGRIRWSICHLDRLRYHNVLRVFYSVHIDMCSHTVNWCDLSCHDLKRCEDTSLSTMQVFDLIGPAMKHHDALINTGPHDLVNDVLTRIILSSTSHYSYSQTPPTQVVQW